MTGMVGRQHTMHAGKSVAVERGIDFVKPGMRIGLGTGSTVEVLVKRLAERTQDGLQFTATATSTRTASLAENLGLEIRSLDDIGALDLTLDGADEVDPSLHLVKGGGGALLWEKIVAMASNRFVVLADISKKVDSLGRFPLPIEIVKFGHLTTTRQINRVLSRLGYDQVDIQLRKNSGKPFVTDEGHYILDLHLRRIANPQELAAEITAVPGVVETGLFLDMADVCIFGHGTGEVEVVRRTESNRKPTPMIEEEN